MVHAYPSVSLVVPVLNREADIGECLDSLLRIDYPILEIIVIDDASTDRTQQIVSKYPVKMVVQKETGGAYAARNEGVDSAQGELVAFTDSDCVVDKDWLKHLAESYYDQGVAGVGGHVLPFKTDRFVGKFLSLGPQELFQSPERVELQRPSNRFLCCALGSGNMSFRRKVLKEVGGFAEDLPACADYEVCWRIQRAGYRLVYEPKAITYHKPRNSLTKLITQFFNLGVSEPKLLKKEPDNFSYVEIKSYLFPSREFRCKLPLRMLVTIDLFNLGILSILLTLINPLFLLIFCSSCLMVAWPTWIRVRKAAKERGNLELVLLYPVLHLIRMYSLSLGRFIGGLKCRVLSF
jgi:cellulose synthase/poly-beta-1,6-N-acetylglucosamine synthase-like glycosyltransferase